MSLFSKPPEPKPDNPRVLYWIFGAFAIYFVGRGIEQWVVSDTMPDWRQVETTVWAVLLVVCIVQLWRTRKH